MKIKTKQLDVRGSSAFTKLSYTEKRSVFAVFTGSTDRYLYKNLPLDVFNGLLQAESKGKFFMANVRGKFEFSVV